MKELYERYIGLYEKTEKDDLVSGLKSEFTKDEMKEIFENLEFEFKESQNKDQIAERMADKGFHDRVKKETEADEEVEGEKERGESEKIEIKESENTEETGEESELEGDAIEVEVASKTNDEDIAKEKLTSTLKTLEELVQEESILIKRFWKNLKKETDKGVKDITGVSKKYLDEIQDIWNIRTDKFQSDIDELKDTDIPEEDLKELRDRWQKLVKQVNQHLDEISDEIDDKKKVIKEIVYEYIGESQRIMEDEEKEMRDLYPLWFDMIGDIREELKSGRKNLEKKEEELLETWGRLSEKVRLEVMKLAEEHEEEAGELLNIWMSLKEDIDEKMEDLPKRYHDIYGKFWKDFGIKKRAPMKDKLMDMSEQYSDILQDSIKSIKSKYQRFVKPSKEDEIEKLKERIARLEEKLDEKDKE